MIPMSERAKTVHALDRAATVLGEVNVYIHVFLASALIGSEWSASRPCRFTTGKERPVPTGQ
jgi:hypothetical protein